MAPTQSAKDITALIQEINSTAAQVSGSAQDNDEARKTLWSAAQKLFWTLETPSESFWRVTMQPAVNAALRTAVDMGLLDSIANSSNGTVSAKELSASTGYNQLLIVRLLRVLTSVGIIGDVGPETYQATDFCRHLVTPNVKDGVKHLFDDAGFTFLHLPAFLEKTRFQNPEDHANGAFQYAFNTKLGLFPWLKEHPERLQTFGNFMSAHRSGRPLWFTFFPVEDKLCQGLREGDDAALIVDVGGNMGHDLAAFKAAFPTTRGRLILQDLPEVIEGIGKNLDASIERTGHDFFKPQPVKGARAYYLSTVLHDWSDASCGAILRHIADAMVPGYSRLLINEFALPDTGCPNIAASFDLTMMAVVGGMERTHTQWEGLLTSVGLVVVKYWTYEGGEFDGLIEARLKGGE